VRWQAVALGLAGGLVGFLFGVVAGRQVWQRVAEGTGAVVETVVPAWAWALAPLGAVVVALMVALVPSGRAAAMRPAEMLRTE
jgi:ABC-type antimicrobial peptide transport system permease subunit